MPRPARSSRSHLSSFRVKDIERYSAFTEERDTASCFLVFQKTGVPSNQNHNIQIIGDSLSARSKTPCPRHPLRYRTTRSAPYQCFR